MVMDPSQSHKIGDIFLKKIFKRSFFLQINLKKLTKLMLKGNLQNVKIYREWKNIDILIVLNETVVCVENKILTKEHSNQLERQKK